MALMVESGFPGWRAVAYDAARSPSMRPPTFGYPREALVLKQRVKGPLAIRDRRRD